MIFGYAIWSDSNNAIFFENCPKEILCPKCDSCLEYEYAPKCLKLKKSSKYDVSHTHELRKLYSEAFVNFCKDELGSKENFQKIDCGWTSQYYMYPSQVLSYDVERRGTRFEKKCDVCGNYESIVGATPILLKTDEPLGPGFFRTDIPFASGRSKFPILMVGVQWKELLQEQKFRGLKFEKIEY